MPKEGQLKLQFRQVIKAGLSFGKLTMYREAFKKVLDGQDPGRVVNDVYKEFLGILGVPSQTKSIKGQKTQASHGQKASKTPSNWMRRRAIKRGKFLRFQLLYELYRRRLMHHPGQHGSLSVPITIKCSPRSL